MFRFLLLPLLPLTLLPSCRVCAYACAQSPGASAKVLWESKSGSEKRLTPSSATVTIAASADAAAPGAVVTFPAGAEDYPGVKLAPPDGAAWNLSAFGHVTAKIVNTGDTPLTLALRVDNAGDWHDNPWNTESITLEPGAAGTLTTIFGYAYGGKPGYALKSAAVSNLLLFSTKADTPRRFRLESLVAGGPAGEKPPIAPDDVRIKPGNGNLLDTAAQTTTAQTTTRGGAQVARVVSHNGGVPGFRLTFPPGAGDADVSLQPTVGRWDLRDYLALQVHVRNDGAAPVTPRVRVDTNGGASDWVSAATPLAPGAEGVVTVPFADNKIADLSRKDTTMTRVTSDAISGVTIAAENASGERRLFVAAITAVAPPLSPPDWMGKRPPAPGDWTKTLDDEFDGTTLDPTLWSVYGDNYWDKASHWSKNNVTVGGGVVRLRYEKKTGHNNDDPTQKSSDYASGYLHTYDRWAQRYGYFEARVKLPTAPGLWPAFWMMPDRGDRADPQWKRQDTANGGMEFDVLEHLTRWGPHRYNIAMHYDGYDKDHKSDGSDKIYVQADKDGFITCGLLWTPGLAVYYANGQEVLRWENPRIAHVPAMLMFTLPTGGWDNDALDHKRLPAEFVVDYVRVWQRKDLAEPGDGRKATVAKAGK